MNRKWLAAFTLCIAVAGWTLLRAQSAAPSPSPAPPPDSATLEWMIGDPLEEPFDVFAMPGAGIDIAGEPGLPFPDPAAGDVFFYSADGAAEIALAGPPEFAEFTAAIPFPPPDPQQGGGGASAVSFTGPDPRDTITFVGFEAGLGNQALTGAPYSATITSEFVQTLSDGNKIERKATTNVYRDGQGRTRREQTLPAIGQYSATSGAPRAIFINDPVARVNYVLDPNRKIARKMTRPNIQILRGGPDGGPERGVAIGPGPGGPGPGGNPPQAGTARAQRLQRRQDQNVTSESLGSQNIEGILVQGTRVTRTIPAGTVGNQNPIQVTSERWYSPDLQINLLVKNVDPMRGTTTTTLSNIRRDEPAASLFQVPSDYTIQEPPNRITMRGQRVAPPPPPQQ
jgi:hypothetical protein